MNFNKFFSVCFFCLLAIKAEAKFIDVNSFQLENGLSVFVVENHRAPIVESRLFYKAGSLNDMVGKGGIAHLLEHMMFRGTKKIKDKEFNNIVEENGVKNNAYTTLDHTTYYEFMGIDKLDLMLALEADRMKNLKIDDEAFLKERDVVLQERKQRFETNPSSLFYENMNTLLWQDGKMANPVSGREKEIIGLTKEDAYEFYSRYYDVSNAILVLAGDITLNQAQEVVGKYFGKLKSNGFDVIEDNESFHSYGLSPAYPVPNDLVEEIKSKDLAQVINRVFEVDSTRPHTQGGVALLTGGITTRVDLTRDATIMALIPLNCDKWHLS